MNERIEIRPDVRFGKPVIRGTRVPVTWTLAEGVAWGEIQRQYEVSAEDIRGAIEFANGLVAEQK